MDLPGVQALLPKAVQSAVEPVQLGLGEGLPPQVVGDAEVGEDPGDPQLPPPEEPGQGGGVLRRDAQAVHPRVQGQVDPDGEPHVRQGVAVGFVHNSLGQPPAAEQGDQVRRRVA